MKLSEYTVALLDDIERRIDPETEDDESIVVTFEGSIYYGDEFEYSEIEGYEYVEGAGWNIPAGATVVVTDGVVQEFDGNNTWCRVYYGAGLDTFQITMIRSG